MNKQEEARDAYRHREVVHNGAKGFGFITPEDGSKDVFVHINDARRSGVDDLREGQRLSYELEQDEGGKTSAIGIKAL